MHLVTPGEQAWEWGIFWTGLPIHPYRDGMTEQQARDWLDEWVAGGGWQESFLLARRRANGPWQVVGATCVFEPSRMAGSRGIPPG